MKINIRRSTLAKYFCLIYIGGISLWAVAQVGKIPVVDGKPITWRVPLTVAVVLLTTARTAYVAAKPDRENRPSV